MASGWAYVGGADFATGSGPTGSLQFRAEPGNQITGSHSLVFYTSSVASPWAGAPNFAKNTLVLSGTLYVSGTISASHFHIRDITEIDATGSTKFGDSTDDTHIRTGSMFVYASRTTPKIPTLIVTASTNGTGTRVGLGVIPSGTLHVQSGDAGTAPFTSYKDLVISSDQSAFGVSILGTNSSFPTLNFGCPADTSAATLSYATVANLLTLGTGRAGAEVKIGTGASNVEAVRVDSDQNVTITAGDFLVNSGDITVSGSDQTSLLKVYSKSKPYILFITSSGKAAHEASITMGGGVPIADPTNGENNLLTVSGSISASVNVSASQFWGDGTNITNVGVISSVANGADNRVTTFSSADALNGEANLTFDGTLLTINGNLTGSNDVTAGTFHGRDVELSGSDQDQLLKIYSKSKPYILFVTSSGAGADEASITMGGGPPQADTDGTNNLVTVSGSISASVNVSASQFWGDGANLTNAGAVSSVTNGVDDRIATFSGADSLNGEANLTFNGSLLTLNGSLTASANISASAYHGTALEIGTDTVRRGTLSTVAGGTRNEATADYSVVVGGFDNTATATYSFVGGGVQNNALATYSAVVCGNGNNVASSYSTIGGGNSSRIGAFAGKSLIGSGEGNIVASDLGAIAGGYHNVIGYASFKVASRSFIGGGNSNTASAQDCVVVGGAGNHIAWGGHRAFIGGGQRNTASAPLAAILGGSGSTVSAAGSVAIGSGLSVAATNTIALGGGTADGGSHQYTVLVEGALSGTYGMEITGGVTRVSAFQGGYKRVTGGDGTMYPIAQETENIYIIGVSSSLTTNDVTVVLPSASIGAGHQIVIKDEWYGTRTAQYAITASVTGSPDLVEGDDHYYMYGSMASVTLYSDGVSKWFVV